MLEAVNLQRDYFAEEVLFGDSAGQDDMWTYVPVSGGSSRCWMIVSQYIMCSTGARPEAERRHRRGAWSHQRHHVAEPYARRRIPIPWQRRSSALSSFTRIWASAELSVWSSMPRLDCRAAATRSPSSHRIATRSTASTRPATVSLYYNNVDHAPLMHGPSS